MSTDKEKTKSGTQPPKNIPKDGQVIMAIMKEMGIQEYDPKCLVQLTEFVYRYSTCILEDSRNFAYNCKKKYLDIEDIKLSLTLASENSFVQPPPREILLECARSKNNTPLPVSKPHCGLRLPPDRFCLSATNYLLKYPPPKRKTATGVTPGLKVPTKQNVSFIKRSNQSPILKQAVTIPKMVISSAAQSHNIIKPRIQIQSGPPNSGVPMQMEVEEGSFKRKREDDDVKP